MLKKVLCEEVVEKENVRKRKVKSENQHENINQHKSVNQHKNINQHKSEHIENKYFLILL